jgi:hypothetical protein
VCHSQRAHHHEAGKIGERNRRFVTVPDTQLVGDIESFRRNRFDPELSAGASLKNGTRELACLGENNARKKPGKSLVEDIIGSDQASRRGARLSKTACSCAGSLSCQPSQPHVSIKRASGRVESLIDALGEAPILNDPLDFGERISTSGVSASSPLFQT